MHRNGVSRRRFLAVGGMAAGAAAGAWTGARALALPAAAASVAHASVDKIFMFIPSKSYRCTQLF